jgi:pimeloyl-ACP methyl ester carboxylesterase
LFDKRDTGLSDRGPGDTPLEEQMTDLQAVMDACGSRRAVLFGYSEGAPMSLLFAATHPERVRALILGAGAARWKAGAGYPCGRGSAAMVAAFEQLARHGWGTGEVEVMDDRVSGLAADIAAWLAALARPGEVLTSWTVKDLVAGSGISFTGRGTHRLPDIPGPWPVFAIGEGRPR